jgi:phosphohistidine phosphatase
VRYIYLLRHAHALAGDPDASDHERSLSARGHEECAAVASRLSAEPVAPEVILCSTAIRTRETLAALAASQPAWPDAQYLPRLYLASPGELLHQLQQLGPDISRVMVVGHNPGLHELALLLATPYNGLVRDSLELGLTTGGFVGLSTEKLWADLSSGGAELLFYHQVVQSARPFSDK